MEEHIRQSNLIEGIDDWAEDAQSMAAWRWLVNKPEINTRVICKLQKRITINQTNLRPDQRGYYRTQSRTNVRVGGRICPPYGLVPSMVKRWVEDYGKGAEDPVIAHIAFEKIHPFVDGNGRTGRMLMWWHELREGKLPTLYTAADRQEYYKLFL